MIPKGNEKKKDLLYRYNKLRASPWHSRRRWWERTHSCCETLQWVDHPYSWPQRRILAIFFSSETLAHPVELPLHRFREPKSCVEMWTAKLRSFTLFIQKKMIKNFQQMIYRETSQNKWVPTKTTIGHGPRWWWYWWSSTVLHLQGLLVRYKNL